MNTTTQQREDMTAALFPDGIPRLWCPLLTHFSAPRQFDAERIGRHLAHIAPYVKGLLVPGSTGEGWEMTDEDIRGLLPIVCEAARDAGVRILVGVLKTDLAAMQACIDSTIDWMCERTGEPDPASAMARSSVVGFTVCPPRGADLSQQELSDALARVLDRGHPTALYQLPQVTENEMAPETVETLAARYGNFYLFKDTSGGDRVALSGRDLGGVFLVRGAEGEYARWTKTAGGPYDGFLLSTANVFAKELSQILGFLSAGQAEAGQALAERIGRVVEGAFAAVGGLSAGNPFTNANKALDHHMAYGASAMDREPAMLYSGVRLPSGVVEAARGLLAANGLAPRSGYMD